MPSVRKKVSARGFALSMTTRAPACVLVRARTWPSAARGKERLPAFCAPSPIAAVSALRHRRRDAAKASFWSTD
jgi:hypothetical protein